MDFITGGETTLANGVHCVRVSLLALALVHYGPWVLYEPENNYKAIATKVKKAGGRELVGSNQGDHKNLHLYMDLGTHGPNPVTVGRQTGKES